MNPVFNIFFIASLISTDQGVVHVQTLYNAYSEIQ